MGVPSTDGGPELFEDRLITSRESTRLVARETRDASWLRNLTTTLVDDLVTPGSRSLLDQFFNSDNGGRSFKQVDVLATPYSHSPAWSVSRDDAATTLQYAAISDVAKDAVGVVGGIVGHEPSSFVTHGLGVATGLGGDGYAPLATTGSSAPATTIHCEGTLCLNLWDDWDVWYNLTNDTDFDYSGEPEAPAWRWEVLLLFAVVILGIMGNVLVCIAVTVEKKLQNVTNYFLMSLAVADLFVSLIVMPCAIVHELVGYWPLGLVMCDIWQVCDVMMCTSSIMHMCTISLDRYIGIKNPLKMRNKSKTIVGVKILLVWFISLAIASPLIFLGIFKPEDIYIGRECAIFNRYFLIYGSLGAFFIPLVIMLVAYSLTIHLLNKQAQKCAEKAKAGMRRSTTRKKPRESKKLDLEPPDHNASRKGLQSGSNGVSKARKLQTDLDRTRAHPSEMQPLAGADNAPAKNGRHDSPATLPGAPSEQPPKTGRALKNFRAIAQLALAEKEVEQLSGAEANGVEVDTTEKFRCLVKKHSAAIKVASLLLVKREEKKEMNTVKTERKAVKVLGTMFAIFVICWGPFFSLNLAMGICTSCDVDVLLFKIFLWLGYISSTLNPIVYTIFNKNFKNTFIYLLTCNRICARHCGCVQLPRCTCKCALFRRRRKCDNGYSITPRVGPRYKYSDALDTVAMTDETNL